MTGRCAHDALVTGEPVVYREEVLTIMMMLGDQRDELVNIRRLLEEEDGEEEATEDPDA